MSIQDKQIEDLTISNLLFPLLISIPIVLYSIILLLLLVNKKNTFPYTNLSYLWGFSYILLLIIIQTLITLDYISSIKYNYYFIRIVGYIFSHTFYNFLFIIPNIFRSVYYMTSIKSTLSHLSKLNSSKTKSNSFFDKRFTFKREGYIVKIIFLPLIILVSILTSLSFISHVECFLYNVNSTNMFFLNSCNQTLSIQNSTVFIEIIIGIAVFFVLSIVSIVISFRLYWFDLKDTFFIRIEIILVSFFWILGRSSLYLMKLYSDFLLEINSNVEIDVKQVITYKRNNFICFSVNVLMYNLLFMYLFIKRSYIDNSQIVTLMIDFDKFLHNGICFNYFKNYLINNNKSLYKYLVFWLEASIFKKIVLINSSPQSNINSVKGESGNKENKTSPSKTSNSGSAEVDSKGNSIRVNKFISEDKEKAKEIISIFIKSMMIKDNFSSSEDCLSVSEKGRNKEEALLDENNNELEMSISYMKLDLPYKVEEDLNNLVDTNFNIINRPKNHIDLAYIFDEAVCFVYHKLHDSFISLKRNQEEKYKLEMLMNYIDFYDQKNESDLEKLRSSNTNSSLHSNWI